MFFIVEINFCCENMFSEAFKWKMSPKSVMVLVEKNKNVQQRLQKALRSFWKKWKRRKSLQKALRSY